MNAKVIKVVKSSYPVSATQSQSYISRVVLLANVSIYDYYTHVWLTIPVEFTTSPVDVIRLGEQNKETRVVEFTTRKASSFYKDLGQAIDTKFNSAYGKNYTEEEKPAYKAFNYLRANHRLGKETIKVEY